MVAEKISGQFSKMTYQLQLVIIVSSFFKTMKLLIFLLVLKLLYDSHRSMLSGRSRTSFDGPLIMSLLLYHNQTDMLDMVDKCLLFYYFMFVGLEFGNPGLTEPLKLWLISRSDRIGSNDSSQHCAHNEEKELIRIPRNQSYKNDLFMLEAILIPMFFHFFP